MFILVQNALIYDMIFEKGESMKRIILLLFSLFVLAGLQGYSQTIPQGTLVVVQPLKTIDADDVKVGENVKFRIVNPVKVNGEVVFPHGTEVDAKIIKRKNNGILGIPGEIVIGEFKIITQNNEIIHLSGIVSDSGDNRYWANVGWIFVWPLLFVKGNDGKVFSHTTHMLYVAEEYEI